MQIWIYSIDNINNKIVFNSIIENHSNSYFRRNSYGIGDFSIVTDSRIEHADLLTKGKIVIFENNPYKMGIITQVSEDETQDGKIIKTVKGFDLKYITKNRIIIPPAGQTNLVASAAADDLIKELVDAYLGPSADSDRIIEFLTIDTNTSSAITYEISKRFTQLYSVLEEIAKSAGVTWQIIHDRVNQKLLLTTSVGTDRSGTVLISKFRDSLKKGEIINSNIDYKNFCYIAGRGEGINRVVRQSYSGLTEPKGIDRIEFFVDARDLTTNDSLDKRASQKLSELSKTIKFNVSALEESPYILDQHYTLGDIISIEVAGFIDTAKVVGITESWSEDGYSIDLNFDYDYPSIPKIINTNTANLSDLAARTELPFLKQGDYSWDLDAELKVDSLILDPTESTPTYSKGRIYWDGNEDTVAIQTTPDTTLQIGAELSPKMCNNTVSTITNGTPVIIISGNGFPFIEPAKASEMNAIRSIGLATQDILGNGGCGKVTTSGMVHDVNTSSFNAGDIIYLAQNGGLTNVKPVYPNAVIRIGYVSTVGTTDGSIFVDVRQEAFQKFFDVFSLSGIYNRAQSTLTYDPSTRTFSISVVSGYWSYFKNGIEYRITSNQTATHSNVTGGYFFYINSSNIFTVSSTSWDLLTDIPICYVYYNSTGPIGVALEERHGVRDPEWHRGQHFNIGTYYVSGLAASGYVLQSAVNADIQFAISSGVIRDEDLGSTLSGQTDAGTYRILYRSGASGDWTIATSTMPYSSGASYGQYNEFTGSTWQLTEVTNGDFYNVYVIGIPALNSDYNILCIPGQAKYASLALAQAAGISSDISWGNLPFVEFCYLHKFTMRAGSSYTSTGKLRIESYSDLRGSNQKVSISGGAAISSHDSLSGVNLAGTSVTYGHIDDQPQTIAGAKTFSSKIISTDFEISANSGKFTMKPAASATNFGSNIDLYSLLNLIRLTATYNSSTYNVDFDFAGMPSGGGTVAIQTSGTYTPAFQSSNTVTYGTRSGDWVRIGSMIFVQVLITWTNVTGTSANGNSISINIPVATATSRVTGEVGNLSGISAGSNTSNLFLIGTSLGVTNILLARTNDSGSSGSLQYSSMSSSGEIQFFIAYKV